MTREPLANESRVTRSAVLSQLLFTAGHSLTSRGFFYYFVNEFHPSARMLALLQVAPESAETAGTLARWIVARVGSRKWLWIALVLGARLAAVGVPLALLWREAVADHLSLWWILLCTVIWYACQGIAYVTFISWLSDLVPWNRWGRFFARWNIASLGVAIIVPAAAGLLRSHYLRTLSPQWQAWSYGVIFLVGGGIVVLSVLPMLRLPDESVASDRELRAAVGSTVTEPHRHVAASRPNVLSLLTDPNYCWFLIHYWWLSFFQGLTQSVVFLYQTRVLQISVEVFYLMNGLMLLLQIPFSVWGGRLSDQNREREVLLGGLLAVSCAMGFWLAATPQRWQLVWGAFAVWGLFGAVNVCEQNLNLKLAPRSDNTLHLALTRQWGGMVAAAAGLLGGWWLDRMTAEMEISPQSPAWPFQLLFAVSWLGRGTAALWLLRIKTGSKFGA